MDSLGNNANEARLTLYGSAAAKAKSNALAAALNSKCLVAKCINIDIPEHFGEKWASYFRRVQDYLEKTYGEKVEELIAFSNRQYVYVCHEGASFTAELIETGRKLRNDENAQLATPAGFADSEGWAYALFTELSNLKKPTELLEGTSFSEFPREADILFAMSIVWFFDAALMYPSDSRKALDVLFEAIDAASLANGMVMWGESEKCLIEDHRNANSKKIKVLNAARHQKNNEAKARAVEEWEKVKSKYSSAEKAGIFFADWLVEKGFVNTIEPRTVTGWIRQHAKKIGVRFR